MQGLQRHNLFIILTVNDFDAHEPVNDAGPDGFWVREFGWVEFGERISPACENGCECDAPVHWLPVGGEVAVCSVWNIASDLACYLPKFWHAVLLSWCGSCPRKVNRERPHGMLA